MYGAAHDVVYAQEENLDGISADLSRSLVATGVVDKIQRITVINVKPVDDATLCQRLSNRSKIGAQTIASIYDISSLVAGKSFPELCAEINKFSMRAAGADGALSPSMCEILNYDRYAGLGVVENTQMKKQPSPSFSYFAVRKNGHIDFFPIRGLEGDNEVTSPALQ